MGREGSGRARRSRLEQGVRRLRAPSIREQAAEFMRRMTRRTAGGLGRGGEGDHRRRERARRNGRDAQGVAAGHRRARRRAAGTARRFRRPDRLEPDQLEGIEAGACSRRRGSANGTGSQWGNYINYGVREFGMSAAINGIALHGGYRPFGGTFLTFSDYSRNALRVAALMKVAVRSSCSRTIRSASAKTARRTSRSNTSRACA